MKNCPSHKQFIAYANGEASEKEILQLEQHTKNCELCSEALPIYKTATLLNKPLKPSAKFNQKTKTVNLITTFSVAASIILLLGLFFIFNQKFENKEFATITTFNKKTLMRKTSTEYWYIGEQLALNDNIINSDNIIKALKNNPNAQQIFVQVECSNINEVEHILQKIKLQNNIPIYTFSTSNKINFYKK